MQKWSNSISEHIVSRIIIMGKPPALPERLPEFDNSGSIRKPPAVNRSKFKTKEAFNEWFGKFKTHSMGLQVPPFGFQSIAERFYTETFENILVRIATFRWLMVFPPLWAIHNLSLRLCRRYVSLLRFWDFILGKNNQKGVFRGSISSRYISNIDKKSNGWIAIYCSYYWAWFKKRPRCDIESGETNGIFRQ